MNQQRKAIHKAYGWHFLAKQIADYTNCTFFEIMDKPAVEVLSLVMVIQAQEQVNKA